MSASEPPIDPDLGRVDATKAHLRPANIALVAAGGIAGTAAREAASLALPSLGGFPFGIFLINVSGAFLLGVLIEALARRGPETARRLRARLLLGTGFLGGFTTYSAFGTDTAQLLLGADVPTALFYALGTVTLGAAATWAGILVGGSVTRRDSA